MKAETQSFYQRAVQKAVARIAQSLDQALDLGAMARLAALSPFHFHRVFRGMVGETPLELHRRLRMERAAHRLINSDENVTHIAFDSGYDTHEAFTRAFRSMYGVPPSAFRDASSDSPANCWRPRQFELAARNGIHFRPDAVVGDFIPFDAGDRVMEIQIKEMPELRLAAVHHVGAYSRISEAFQKLGEIAGRGGLFRYPDPRMIAVYHDDPETTPTNELRSDAGITVPNDVALPEGLGEIRLAKGRYACATHIGSYTKLGDTWASFMGEWLPQSGERVGEGVAFEIYRNNPTNTPENELRTELYLPLA